MTWTPATTDADPPTDDWLLVVIKFNEPHTPDAVRLAYWDQYDKGWRTQFGKLKEHWQVTHWMRLPEMPEEAQ